MSLWCVCTPFMATGEWCQQKLHAPGQSQGWQPLRSRDTPSRQGHAWGITTRHLGASTGHRWTETQMDHAAESSGRTRSEWTSGGSGTNQSKCVPQCSKCEMCKNLDTNLLSVRDQSEDLACLKDNPKAK